MLAEDRHSAEGMSHIASVEEPAAVEAEQDEGERRHCGWDAPN